MASDSGSSGDRQANGDKQMQRNNSPNGKKNGSDGSSSNSEESLESGKGKQESSSENENFECNAGGDTGQKTGHQQQLLNPQTAKTESTQKFQLINRTNITDIDEIEKRFRARNRALNQCAKKAQIQKPRLADDDGEKTFKTVESLKIKDESSSDESSDDEEVGTSDEDDYSLRDFWKSKKVTARARVKGLRVQYADEVASYESDDGDDDGREYDYVSDDDSDSACDTDEDAHEAMVAVGDEPGLRRLIKYSSTDSDDSSSDEVDETIKKLLAAGQNSEHGDQALDDQGMESSDSEWEDPDKQPYSSMLFPAKQSSPFEEEDSSSPPRKRQNRHQTPDDLNDNISDEDSKDGDTLE